MHFARLKNHDYRGEGYTFVTFATAPRRALLPDISAGLIRHDNPQWFAKQTDVVHPRLPPETRWTAYGDHTLLDDPITSAFRARELL